MKNSAKIKYEVKEYTSKKDGKTKKAYNLKLVYDDGRYILLKPQFEKDYPTLFTLIKLGIVEREENN